jgi:hypothetical protein
MARHVLWRLVGSAFIPAYQVLAPHRTESQTELHIGVVFTNFEDTRAALKTAADLCAGLEGHIDLVVPEVVPYPLPLIRPAVPAGFTLRRLMELARGAQVQPNIYVYLCRDKVQTLLEVLAPHSVVVLGRKKRWFPVEAQFLARALRKQGHHVILVKWKKSLQ